MSEIKAIHTSCRECTFAKYEGESQVDCEMGTLNKMEHIGAYDNDNKFFIINGRKCPHFLTKGKFKDVEYAKNFVMASLQIKMTALVYYDDGSSIEDLNITLNSLQEQRLKPTKVIVIDHRDKIDMSLLVYLRSYTGLPWELQGIVEEADRGRAIDCGVNKVKDNVFCVFNAGFSVPKSFIYNFNYKINHDLDQVSMVMPDDKGNGLITAKNLFKAVAGNRTDPFTTKICKQAKEEESETLIVDMEVLCQDCPQLA